MHAVPANVAIVKKRTMIRFKETEKLAKAYSLDVLAAFYLELEGVVDNFRACYHLDS